MDMGTDKRVLTYSVAWKQWIAISGKHHVQCNVSTAGQAFFSVAVQDFIS